MKRRLPAGVRAYPGTTIGSGVVFDLAPDALVVLGPSARIGPRCRFTVGPGARVEIDGTLEERCRISAELLVVVDAGAHLGAECVLIDADPVFADPETPVRLQGTRSAPVRVGAGAVLGPRSAVLRGGEIAPGERLLAFEVRRAADSAVSPPRP